MEEIKIIKISHVYVRNVKRLVCSNGKKADPHSILRVFLISGHNKIIIWSSPVVKNGERQLWMCKNTRPTTLCPNLTEAKPKCRRLAAPASQIHLINLSSACVWTSIKAEVWPFLRSRALTCELTQCHTLPRSWRLMIPRSDCAMFKECKKTNKQKTEKDLTSMACLEGLLAESLFCF